MHICGGICVYIWRYICICMHVGYICVMHVCGYICVFVWGYICICMCRGIYVYIWGYICICLCGVGVYMCICVGYIYVYMCVWCTYVHYGWGSCMNIHTHRFKGLALTVGTGKSENFRAGWKF